jgi:Domain of unknown function (DUF4262)
MTPERKKALALIKRNIEKSGFHIYIVSGGTSPRFVYTIGLREWLGAELVMAGGLFYEKNDDVLDIVHSLRKQLAKPSKLGPVWQSQLSVPRLGKFTLRKAHASWSRSLLLGALDYYSIDDVDAYQIVPETQHRTIDVPDMSKEWSATAEPVWGWLHEDETYPVSLDAEVMTPLDVLRGDPVTEACRWEDGYWEMFAGSDRDVPESEARLVPLGWLLALDPSLAIVLDLTIGEGVWREDRNAAWRPMRSNRSS